MSNQSQCHCKSKTVDQVILDIKKECGQRRVLLTSIREKVLRILLEEKKSIKAYELLDRMTKIHKGAKPITVYRALDFLVEEGFVHRIDSLNAWSACHHMNHHHHDLIVVCTSCGCVSEIDDGQVTQQLHDLVSRKGYIIQKPEMEIQAICERCKTKETV